MITIFTKNFNHISQKTYDSLINELSFHALRCSCTRTGFLHRHGYYARKVKTLHGTVRLHILRVRCSECGRTHALLPSSLVPYSQISLLCHFLAIRAHQTGGNPYAVCTPVNDIDENNVKSILLNYRRFFKERLIASSIPLTSVREVVTRGFTHYSRQFMQIHKCFNSLFSFPT